MADLMELVNTCEVAMGGIKTDKAESAMSRISELKHLGFNKAAGLISDALNPKMRIEKIAFHKFICISEKKIQDYLNRKADEYNKKWTRATGGGAMGHMLVGNSFAIPVNSNVWLGGGLAGISSPTPPRQETPQEYTSYDTTYYDVPTMHSGISAEGTIGHFRWIELHTKDYEKIPPKEVLTRLKEVQEMEVFDNFTVAEVNQVKDPLLLGRIRGSKDRYFIAQWGDDVSLDDVI